MWSWLIDEGPLRHNNGRWLFAGVVTGENGQLKYLIAAGDSETQFNMDELSGVITVAKPLDRETRSRYELTVEAVDQAVDPDRRLTSSVTVSHSSDVYTCTGGNDGQFPLDLEWGIPIRIPPDFGTFTVKIHTEKTH